MLAPVVAASAAVRGGKAITYPPVRISGATSRFNADLKQVIGTKVPVRTMTKLKLAATEHRVRIEQSSEQVKSYLQDPRVQ